MNEDTTYETTSAEYYGYPTRSSATRSSTTWYPFVSVAAGLAAEFGILEGEILFAHATQGEFEVNGAGAAFFLVILLPALLGMLVCYAMVSWPVASHCHNMSRSMIRRITILSVMHLAMITMLTKFAAHQFEVTPTDAWIGIYFIGRRFTLPLIASAVVTSFVLIYGSTQSTN